MRNSKRSTGGRFLGRQNPPAFQLYPNDEIADLFGCSVVAHGVFARLRCLCWLRGALPSDKRELARLCDLSPAVFAAAYSQIRFLFRRRGAALIIPKLETEREKQKKRAHARRVAGEIGAAIRWSGTPPTGRSLARVLMKLAFIVFEDPKVLEETKGDQAEIWEIYKTSCAKNGLPYAPADDPEVGRRAFDAARRTLVGRLRRRVAERARAIDISDFKEVK